MKPPDKKWILWICFMVFIFMVTYSFVNGQLTIQEVFKSFIDCDEMFKGWEFRRIE